MASYFLVSDWLDYLVIGVLEMGLYHMLTGLHSISPHLSVLALLAFLFACNEKTRKESWVVSHTNAKTKKILMGLLNQ